MPNLYHKVYNQNKQVPVGGNKTGDALTVVFKDSTSITRYEKTHAKELRESFRTYSFLTDEDIYQLKERFKAIKNDCPELILKEIKNASMKKGGRSK